MNFDGKRSLEIFRNRKPRVKCMIELGEYKFLAELSDDGGWKNDDQEKTCISKKRLVRNTISTHTKTRSIACKKVLKTSKSRQKARRTRDRKKRDRE